MAWWYRKYANEQSAKDQGRYEFAEQEAKAKKVGLWQDKNPQPPWEYRRSRIGSLIGKRVPPNCRQLPVASEITRELPDQGDHRRSHRGGNRASPFFSVFSQPIPRTTDCSKTTGVRLFLSTPPIDARRVREQRIASHPIEHILRGRGCR